MDSTVGTTAVPMQLPAVDSGATLLSTAGYLFLLLGVIFLAYYLLKRFGVPGAMTSGRGGPRMVSRLMLGNRQSVTVIRYREKDLLLGVTENQITLLAETEADQAEAPSVPAKNFASLLKRSTRDAS